MSGLRGQPRATIRRPAGVAHTTLHVLLGLPPKASGGAARALAGAREVGGLWVLDDVV